MQHIFSGIHDAALSRQAHYSGWEYDEHIRIKNFDESIPDRHIAAVAVHACKSEVRIQGLVQKYQVAHFRLFLILSAPPSAERSVELNNFSHNRLVTTTEIAYRRYLFSRTETFITVEMASTTTPHPTVREVLDHLFNEKKRHLYQLDSDTGSGCRYWCQTVLKDIARKGWLHNDAPHKTEQIADIIQHSVPGVLVSEVGNPKGGQFY
ncbi:hypothetical protein GGU10DRAFT_387102 [Lentinula aff. detonsa]|uniref:DUF7770 domain-containing protein n=1 Tax=Lentinula aff. detonsa TaxID=2804958 RepID=A0AA38NM93_9AGAR|nr:hypothetical protein GGU10DRAFT_387102 [Lentinula aff. detonsa]